MHPDEPTLTRHRGYRSAAAAALVVLTTAGCSAEPLDTGFLPSERGTTDQTERIINLWNGSWIAALIVGVLTWGLIFWCMAAYRRRKGETGLPAQLRYHLPLEMMYTIIPLFMMMVLFYFTARDTGIVTDVDGEADVRIQVVGKRWAWDFNYTDENVYETSEQVPAGNSLNGLDTRETQIPTLYLPVGQSIELTLDSRDVIHSFWVPAFLYKEDMVPGRNNQYQFTPLIEGTYAGKCAELCGEFHSDMLFQVEVVSQDVFDEQMAELSARGQTGELEVELGRVDNTERAEAESDDNG